MIKYVRLNPQNKVQEIVYLDDHVDPQSLHFDGYPLIQIEEDSPVREGWVWDGGNLSAPKVNFLSLVHHINRSRKDKQFTGCEVDGVLVECTQESISSILALRDGMKEKHLPSTVMFKATTAYIDVTIEDVEEMLRIARQYFQKCFDLEAECMSKVSLGEITSITQIDRIMEEALPQPRHLWLPRDEDGRMMPAHDFRKGKRPTRAASKSKEGVEDKPHPEKG